MSGNCREIECKFHISQDLVDFLKNRIGLDGYELSFLRARTMSGNKSTTLSLLLHYTYSWLKTKKS